MTLTAGRVTRRLSANDEAASRSTPGPSTTACSSEVSPRARLSSSRLGATLVPGPETDRNSSAFALLFSTMIGMPSPEEVLLADADGRPDLRPVVEQPEGQLTVGGGEQHLLGLLLVHREGEQGPGQALGGGGTTLAVGGCGRGHRGLRHGDDLDLRQQQPGAVLSSRAHRAV